MLKSTLYVGHAMVILATFATTNLMSQNAPEKPAHEGQHFRAKQLLGAKVQISSDMSIGILDDIVLDDNGNVDYLIVANQDKKLVTVPWDAAAFDVETRIATIRITPEQFKQVPTYSVEQYPVFSTPTYRTQIYKSYGLTPAQERRAIRRGATVVK